MRRQIPALPYQPGGGRTAFAPNGMCAEAPAPLDGRCSSQASVTVRRATRSLQATETLRQRVRGAVCGGESWRGRAGHLIGERPSRVYLLRCAADRGESPAPGGRVSASVTGWSSSCRRACRRRRSTLTLRPRARPRRVSTTPPDACGYRCGGGVMARSLSTPPTAPRSAALAARSSPEALLRSPHRVRESMEEGSTSSAATLLRSTAPS
jgi:hypothetical protein